MEQNGNLLKRPRTSEDGDVTSNVQFLPSMPSRGELEQMAFGELQRQVEFNFNTDAAISVLIDLAQDLLASGTQFERDNDKRSAFIAYGRAISLEQIIANHRETEDLRIRVDRTLITLMSLHFYTVGHVRPMHLHLADELRAQENLPKLPSSTTTIQALELFALLKASAYLGQDILLLIDIRTKKQYAAVHIKHSAIVNLDSHVLCPNAKAMDIERNLFSTNGAFHALFETRRCFRYVVYYDADSCQKGDLKFELLHQAIWNKEGQRTKRQPLLLNGGIRGFIKLAGLDFVIVDEEPSAKPPPASTAAAATTSSNVMKQEEGSSSNTEPSSG